MKIRAIKASTLNVPSPPPRKLEWSIRRTPVWREEPVLDNGHLRVPNRPGHGMEFSEKALAEYVQ